MCSGYESSKWDDAVDLAFMATSPDFSPPEDQFVMTSWHNQEQAEFFVLYTSFDFFEPAALVIVAVGDGPDTADAELLVREIVADRLQSNKTMEATR